MQPVDEMVTIKPDMRVIHPEYGDITEDVARELAAIRQEDHERLVREADMRQRALVAARPGQAYIKKGFAVRAEIDPAVHAYWRMREGPGFWKHEMKWFLKKNPICAVKAIPERLAVNMGGHALPPPKTGVRGKRGRWAA